MPYVALSWNANPATDNVTTYDVWRGTGTSVAFGSCAKIGSIDGTSFTDTTVAYSTAYTYYIVADNAAGSSSPEGPYNITSSGPDPTYVQGPGSSTNGDIALFNGTTGEKIKDAGIGLPASDGQLIIGSSAGMPVLATLTAGSNITITNGHGSIQIAASGGGGSGTVTSVGLSLPADFTVSGSPVTTSGTLTGAWANENANVVHAGPASGSAAAPTWRALVAADLPLATSSAFGAVKPDNSTITISGGVISSTGGATGANPTATAGPAAINGSATTFMRSDAAPAVQKCSSSQFGLCEVDGTTITAASGVISAATATSSAPGIVEPDNVTVTISGGVISANNVVSGGSSASFVIPMAATSLISHAAVGEVVTPLVNMTVVAVGITLTTASGGAYKLGIAPFNTSTLEITAAPNYISGTLSDSAPAANRGLFGKLATPLALTAGDTYLLIMVRTDSTTTVSQTINWNNITSGNVFIGPGFQENPSAGGTAYGLSSTAPLTSQTWVSEGSGNWSFSLIYSV
jgi:hypothetical protein